MEKKTLQDFVNYEMKGLGQILCDGLEDFQGWLYSYNWLSKKLFE